MKIYHGYRTSDGVVVEIIEDIKNGKEVHDIHGLKVRKLKHVVRHSPTGLEYGYGGSGPSDLARSILLDIGYPENEVDMCYQDFKFVFIARLDQEQPFEITEDAIKIWWDQRHGGTNV